MMHQSAAMGRAAFVQCLLQCIQHEAGMSGPACPPADDPSGIGPAEAMKQKASRGELFLTVAVGYVNAGGDRIEKDADRRVQEALALVFRKFSELQTIRQVLVWLRQEKILLPVLGVGAAADRIGWRLPVYPTVHHVLTNPVYGGAYAFGRRTARVTIENGPLSSFLAFASPAEKVTRAR